jgi:hypothetical protein
MRRSRTYRLAEVREGDIGECKGCTGDRDEAGTKKVLGLPQSEARYLEGRTESTPYQAGRNEVLLSCGPKIGTCWTSKKERRGDETADHRQCTVCVRVWPMAHSDLRQLTAEGPGLSSTGKASHRRRHRMAALAVWP